MTNKLSELPRPTFYQVIRPATRKLLSEIANREAVALAALFYDYFLQDKEASIYLTHDDVHKRLADSLAQWIRDLFNADLIEINEKTQEKIGRIHARLGIPIHLVLRGAILIKNRIGQILSDAQHDPIELSDSILFSCNRIDKAMALMSSAYVSNTKRSARAAEAYRVMSLGQDMMTEREGQRIALMEWSQEFLFTLLSPEGTLPSISASSFGLWLRHRAVMLFDGTPELERLIHKAKAFDNALLSQARHLEGAELQAFIAKFQITVDELKYLLSAMFERVLGLEQGVDPLTSVLNRRFLPTIFSRELAIATRERTGLSVAILDVDHFKQINDRFGHPGGDIALRQIAERIQTCIRPSDLIFRYGGEEFLIILVELDGAGAVTVADCIREIVAKTPFRMPDNTSLTVTVSIGVAAYDGHPDYEFLIQSADKALYEAKNRGRNRVVRATPYRGVSIEQGDDRNLDVQETD